MDIGDFCCFGYFFFCCFIIRQPVCCNSDNLQHMHLKLEEINVHLKKFTNYTKILATVTDILTNSEWKERWFLSNWYNDPSQISRIYWLYVMVINKLKKISWYMNMPWYINSCLFNDSFYWAKIFFAGSKINRRIFH